MTNKQSQQVSVVDFTNPNADKIFSNTTSLFDKLKKHLDSITPEQFNKEVEDIQQEFNADGPTMEEFICDMEDCPHCAYERQQEYEAELEKDACIEFGDWLTGQGISYIDNTDEGNVYMVESNMNRSMTMKQIYELYLKEQG